MCAGIEPAYADQKKQGKDDDRYSDASKVNGYFFII